MNVIWSELHFNFYIRTCIELYIEGILVAFLNVSTTQSLATVGGSVLLITGVLACGLFMGVPSFLSMHIGHNYQTQKRREFNTITGEL